MTDWLVRAALFPVRLTKNTARLLRSVLMADFLTAYSLTQSDKAAVIDDRPDGIVKLRRCADSTTSIAPTGRAVRPRLQWRRRRESRSSCGWTAGSNFLDQGPRTCPIRTPVPGGLRVPR